MDVVQIIFMEALGGVFKVSGQTWQEWVAAIAIGAGSMPLALVVKFFARSAPSRAVHASPPCTTTSQLRHNPRVYEQSFLTWR